MGLGDTELRAFLSLLSLLVSITWSGVSLADFAGGDCKSFLLPGSLTKIADDEGRAFAVAVIAKYRSVLPSQWLRVELKNPKLAPFPPPLFPVALTTENVRDRLAFIFSRLITKQQKLRVRVAYWKTEVDYTPVQAGERTDTEQNPRITIEFHGHELYENLDMALVGIVSEIFLPELHDYFANNAPKRVALWEDWISTLVEKTKPRGFNLRAGEALEQTIRRFVYLRNVWNTKLDFCEGVATPAVHDREIELHSYLSDAHEPLCVRVKKFRSLQRAFAEFNDFDLELVKFLWSEGNPNGWDHPIAFPPVGCRLPTNPS